MREFAETQRSSRGKNTVGLGPRPIRILLVGDGGANAESHRQELVEQPQFDVCCRTVTCAWELAQLCLDQSYGAVVCDATVQGPMSMEALELIRQRDLAIPFIVVLDTLDVNDGSDEDLLTEFMLRGATDCVEQRRLHVLSAAVTFAVEQRFLIEERHRLDRELERSLARYQARSAVDDMSVQRTSEVTS